MRKLILISIIIFVTILASGCTIKESKNQNSATDKLFEKKGTCALYKEEVSEKVYENIEKNISFYQEVYNVDTKQEEITQEHGVFYSPTENSCLYYIGITFMWDLNTNFHIYEIGDLFTGKILHFHKEGIVRGSEWGGSNGFSEYQEQKDKYKHREQK